LFFAYAFGGGNVACEEGIAKSGIGAIDDRRAQLSGEAEHKAKIVDAAEAIVELFFGAEEVMDVGGAIVQASVTIATVFDGSLDSAEAGGLDIDASGMGEETAVASDAGRENAIEHIHTEADADNQIFRGANAEEMAGFQAREFGSDLREHVPQFFFWFADREAANGEARKGQIADEAGTLLAEFGFKGPLNDAEEGLLRAVEVFGT
jgi:hypothetical protein